MSGDGLNAYENHCSYFDLNNSRLLAVLFLIKKHGKTKTYQLNYQFICCLGHEHEFELAY